MAVVAAEAWYTVYTLPIYEQDYLIEFKFVRLLIFFIAICGVTFSVNAWVGNFKV
jgi:hypothetical protein